MSFRFGKLLKFASYIASFFSLVILTACSFAPVYADPALADTKFNLSFDQGTTRLEQIVYADLVAHFGRASGQDAKNVNIVVSSSDISPGSGSVGLKGIVTVSKNDQEVLFSGTRTSSATYVSTSQSLANQQAANEASERAAHQLAETIRLTLISVLSFQSNQ